jgi:hypothetical protein
LAPRSSAHQRLQFYEGDFRLEFEVKFFVQPHGLPIPHKHKESTVFEGFTRLLVLLLPVDLAPGRKPELTTS